jgi:hypothetical protein
LRFDEIEDPEAYEFFNTRKNSKKEALLRYSSNKPKTIQSNPNCNQFLKGSKISAGKGKSPGKFIRQETCRKDMHKYLYEGKDFIPAKMHLANITASKFRSENYMRSFYEEETKNDTKKVRNNKGNSNSNEKEKRSFETNKDNYYNKNKFSEKNFGKNNKFEEYQKSEISVIKKAGKTERNFLYNKNNENNIKEAKKDEYEYENVDTPVDGQLNGIDANEKILTTINLISKNKNKFNETNKILKEIGNFYKDKKHILENFHANDNVNDSDEKLKNYLKEFQKIHKDNEELDQRIEKLSSKGSLHTKMTKIHNEIKKSQNSLVKGKHIISNYIKFSKRFF